MSVGRFIFHTILAIVFSLTAIIGPIIIDGFMIGIIAIIEIMAFIVLLISMVVNVLNNQQSS